MIVPANPTEPKFELLQSVQMRGRYEPRAEIRRGIVESREWCSGGELKLSGWLYSVNWVGEPETGAMLEFDLEPAKLLVT